MLSAYPVCVCVCDLLADENVRMLCCGDRTGSKMGISPLMLAAMNGHTAAVKLLLDMGSDVNAQVLHSDAVSVTK